MIYGGRQSLTYFISCLTQMKVYPAIKNFFKKYPKALELTAFPFTSILIVGGWLSMYFPYPSEIRGVLYVLFRANPPVQ